MKCETAILQNTSELSWLITILQTENVRSFLEIGSKFGGSLWRIANALPKGSRVVSVDLPHGDKSFKESQQPLEECVAGLNDRFYEAHLLIGDSTDQKIVDAVRLLSPFDACFIDANHTEPFIRKDWTNYGPMCRLVAFHDVNHTQPTKKKPIQVRKIWNEIKSGYRHQEIRLDNGINGIGVLWRN